MKSIESTEAPKAIGPYSQGILHNGLIFCSGQIGLDPKTGLLDDGDILKQTERTIQNIQGVLTAAKADLKDIIKVDVFLKNMSDFEQMNTVYSQMFTSKPLPARVTVEVAKLPKNALIEISCIAVLPN